MRAADSPRAPQPFYASTLFPRFYITHMEIEVIVVFVCGVREKLVSARGGQVDFRTQLFIQPGDEMQMADMADFCLYYILICISYRVIIIGHARMQIYIYNWPLRKTI
jgi:hypothetical protein